MNDGIVDVKNDPEAEQLSKWLAIIGVFFRLIVAAIIISFKSEKGKKIGFSGNFLTFLDFF